MATLPSTPSHQDRQEPFSQTRPAHQDTAQDDEPHSETGATYTLNVPNPAVAYGGVDPEIEENYRFARGVSDEGLRRVAAPWKRPKLFHPRTTASQSQSSLIADAMSTPIAVPVEAPNRLLQLPLELIDTILSYISPLDLANVAQVCRDLHRHSNSELHWRQHVLDNLPKHQISSPYPCSSWRDLYIAHEAQWFLPRYKIWFCDRELTGHVLIVRYDERRGCIEGYQMLATRERDGSEPWSADAGVHIHYFEPKVRLHLDRPIVQFDIRNPSEDEVQLPRHPSFDREYPMRLFPGGDPRCSTFLRAKRVDDGIVAHRTAALFPYGFVWPPPAIPAGHRVIGQPASVHRTSSTPVGWSSSLWKPNGRDEASDQTFRIRTWLELGPAQLGVHIGEEVSTYSTLDPYLYTPTAEKPWRGIWVGDYSGHGCEFLLINQPDQDEDGPREPLVRELGETEEAFQDRFLHERVYQGRLEGIKLTGDPNVPRGEYTFVAEDLGDNGFVGIASEPPFQGARMVRSKGHIAQTGFHDDKYISSQLVLLSNNRLAQYWVDFGHISYFERVNIDQFLVP